MAGGGGRNFEADQKFMDQVNQREGSGSKGCDLLEETDEAGGRCCEDERKVTERLY